MVTNISFTQNSRTFQDSFVIIPGDLTSKFQDIPGQFKNSMQKKEVYNRIVFTMEITPKIRPNCYQGLRAC